MCSPRTSANRIRCMCARSRRIQCCRTRIRRFPSPRSPRIAIRRSRGTVRRTPPTGVRSACTDGRPLGWHGCFRSFVTLLCRLVFRTVRGGTGWPRRGASRVAGRPGAGTAFGGGTGRQTRGRLRRAGRPVMLCAGRPDRVPPSMAGPLFDVLPPDGGARRRIREPFGASSVFGGDPDPAGQGFLKQVSLFPVVGNRGLEGSWTVRCLGCAGRRTSA